MKYLSDEIISQLHEAGSHIEDAIARMYHWDGDLQSEADYEEAYALYKHWLSRLNWIYLYSGVLMDIPDNTEIKLTSL